MSIHKQLTKLEPEFLAKALEFAAHAMNDADSIGNACKELGISRAHGYAYARLFTELGIMGFASIKNNAELDEASKTIEADMRNPNNITAGVIDTSSLTCSGGENNEA